MDPAQVVDPHRPADASRASETDRRAELRDRLAIAILLVPLALFVVYAGGVLFLLAVILLFTVAAAEYVRLFVTGHQRPAGPVIVGGVALLLAAEYYPVLNPGGLLPALLVVVPLAWHLVDYERGAAASGTDFAITLAGLFYLGGLGRYFIAVRALPDGLWWLLATLMSTWLADTGAYTFGRLFGRHRLAPRLSPKKTWEGYTGSVFAGCLGGAVLGWLLGLGAGPDSLLNWQTGAGLGVLIGALAPVGDLGVSMFKRQMGVKDTGAMLPGHGGALDRIDSWLVTVVAAYYFLRVLPSLVGG